MWGRFTLLILIFIGIPFAPYYTGMLIKYIWWSNDKWNIVGMWFAGVLTLAAATIVFGILLLFFWACYNYVVHDSFDLEDHS